MQKEKEKPETLKLQIARLPALPARRSQTEAARADKADRLFGYQVIHLCLSPLQQSRLS
jgi:hypothetical protein